MYAQNTILAHLPKVLSCYNSHCCLKLVSPEMWHCYRHIEKVTELDVEIRADWCGTSAQYSHPSFVFAKPTRVVALLLQEYQ